MQISLNDFADRIGEIIPVLMKNFAKRLVKELYKEKITLAQFLILEVLYREGESTMSALASCMNVTTAAMTGIIDRLVRDDYIERMHDSSDRRIIKVKLTATGNDLVKKISEQRRQMFIKVFGRISETDRDNYLRILTQIKNILSSEPTVIE